MRILIILFMSAALAPWNLSGQTILDMFVDGPSEFDRKLGPDGQRLLADKAQSAEFVPLEIAAVDPDESPLDGDWRLSVDLANG